MQKRDLWRFVEASAVMLFFLQALRVLCSLLFGLIYDVVFGSVTPDAVITLFLAVGAFTIAGGTSRSRARESLRPAAGLVALARVALSLPDPSTRLAAAIAIITFGGVYLASLLWAAPELSLRACVVGLVVEQFLRAAGNTYDVTLRAQLWPLGLVWTAALLWVSARAARVSRTRLRDHDLGWLGGLGLGGFLFLQVSLLALPNAVARWSGTDYALVTPLVLLVTALPVLLGWHGPDLFPRPTLLVVACAGIAAGHILEGRLAVTALLFAQAAVVSALPAVVRQEGKRPERLGRHLSAGLLALLLLNFLYAFAFTYAYTLNLFRGTGWITLVIGAVLATLPATLRDASQSTADSGRPKAMVAGAIGLAALASAVVARSPALRPQEAGPTLRVGTYNIHYGFGTYWDYNLEDMAQAIEDSRAEVVFLQEVDAGRITSYSVDNALWLSRRLGMGVTYGPTMEHMTGIAVLHRLPLLESEMALLPSQLEQTAIIRTRLDSDEGTVDAYGTWLGLEAGERAAQLDAALGLIRPGPALFGGDLNATPDSPVYARLAEAGFVDPYLASGAGHVPTSPSEGPQERIDYVWVRGLRPVSAEVLASTASDHRMVVVEVALK